MILALWLLSFLALLVIYSGHTAIQQINAQKRIEEYQAVLDDAYNLRLVVQEYLKKFLIQDKGVQRIGSLWRNNPNFFSNIKLAKAKSQVYFKQKDFLRNQYILYWGLSDEESRLNINKVDLFVLKKFLMEFLPDLKAEQIAVNIIDWRDSDDLYNNLINKDKSKSEKMYYSEQNLPYYPANREFVSLKEILLVPGVSLDLFLQIKEYITVHSSGKINLNTATGEVLLALGLPESLVNKIIQLRSGPDRIEGTYDDLFFSSQTEVLPLIEKLFGLTLQEKEAYEASKGYFDTKSYFFRLQADIDLAKSKINGKIYSVFDRDNIYENSFSIIGQKRQQ